MLKQVQHDKLSMFGLFQQAVLNWPTTEKAVTLMGRYTAWYIFIWIKVYTSVLSG